jgi:hypothetical protein
MQKFAMVSRNSYLADDAASGLVIVTPSGRGPMVHQLDSICGNQPTPQIMIQLIGCRIDTARPHEGRKSLTAATNSSG